MQSWKRGLAFSLPPFPASPITSCMGGNEVRTSLPLLIEGVEVQSGDEGGWVPGGSRSCDKRTDTCWKALWIRREFFHLDRDSLKGRTESQSRATDLKITL